MSDPDRFVRSADGTAIAVFSSGAAAPGTAPLVLVHGTTADHLTFRVVGPLLGRRRRLHAIDRRGRGASGDAPSYAVEREFEDVAAVAEALADEAGSQVDVLGHSFGGRCALGASLLTASIRRVVSYEGAPAPADRPYQPAGLADRLQAHLGRGDREAVLETFMREVVGMDDAGMARFRADPVWPLRVAASPTILRELDAERSPAASLAALGRVNVPVLQVLGTVSVGAFQEATAALDARLPHGSIARIEGAAHAAHHTHPEAFVTAVEAFLPRPSTRPVPATMTVRSGHSALRNSPGATTIRGMTDSSAPAPAAVPAYPYSPGLAGVPAAETALGSVDGAAGRLTYRGYRIGDLVEHGSYAAVANLLWTGEWDASHHLPTAPVPAAVMTALRTLPTSAKPMDALRTAVSAWGATQTLEWPPSADQARALTAFSPSALAAFARVRRGLEPVEPDPDLDLVPGFLYQLTGARADASTARALDAYFVVGAEHGLNASTFTARVITSTRSDIASAVCGAIGAMKGPLHGGAPSEVVEQLHKVGSPERAEQWVRDALDRGERLMGFGHRVYRAYDPRAAALRKVVEAMDHKPEWLDLAIKVEDVALRVLAEKHPERPLKTNVEYYAAAVLQGVGLSPDLFPATFALARHAGWTAHILEQAADNRLIRPDAIYTGPAERDLPA